VRLDEAEIRAHGMVVRAERGDDFDVLDLQAIVVKKMVHHVGSAAPGRLGILRGAVADVAELFDETLARRAVEIAGEQRGAGRVPDGLFNEVALFGIFVAGAVDHEKRLQVRVEKLHGAAGDAGLRADELAVGRGDLAALEFELERGGRQIDGGEIDEWHFREDGERDAEGQFVGIHPRVGEDSVVFMERFVDAREVRRRLDLVAAGLRLLDFLQQDDVGVRGAEKGDGVVQADRREVRLHRLPALPELHVEGQCGKFHVRESMAARAACQRGSGVCINAETNPCNMHKLVLIRHGESTWNKENRFTGWHDVDLTEEGRAQAKRGGEVLKAEGFSFDLAYVSTLKRALRTLWIVLDELDELWIPVEKSWRLNERHYGALQGLNKGETAAKFGDEQVKIWRRSYDIPPPALEESDERFPGHDPRYAGVPKSELPLTECLKDTVARFLPLWQETIAPQVKAGKKVIIAAHGNSLRALVKYLDNMTEEEILELNIPTGIPLVYELDDDLKPIKHYYLGDQEAIAAAAAAVAAQGKAK